MSTGEKSANNTRLLALPVLQGQLSMHFGHCEHFALITVDLDSQQIVEQRQAEPPPHEPGVLPKWLSQQGVDVIITGGMGGRAQQLFAQYDVEVVVGAPAKTPEEVVADYLQGSLQGGQNFCDH